MIKTLYYGTFLVGLVLSAIAAFWGFSWGIVEVIDGNPYGFVISILSPIVFYVGIYLSTVLCLVIYAFN